MADTSTVSFFLALVVGFVVAKWAFAGDDSAPRNSAPRRSNAPRQPPAPRRRAVNQTMIDIVQSIAPNLAVEQIRYDLERTGNVEATIERYLQQGSLPFPPNYVPPAAQPSSSTSFSSSKSASSGGNLLSKYNLDKAAVSSEIPDTPLEKMAWKDTKEERQAQLKKRQQEMVLRARQKLAKKEQETTQ